LLALWFVLCRHLAGEWSVNEQYSYGWFVPFFTFFLFWLRWEDRPEREVGGRRSEVRRQRVIAVAIGIGALLILAPLRLIEIANPDWRPLGWLHTGAVATITFLILWSAGGTPWLKHFAFPIGFFFVAIPWISPIEQPIVQGLMRMVAAVATEVLTLCGIPAQLEGSLIRVSTGLVGVNEACSGVRSLQTSLMIGLLFGELKRFSTGKRLALICGAIALAIVANFGRAFLLVWIAATRGTQAVEGWHDFTGYSIVVVVFCGTLLLATLLNRSKGERRKEESHASDNESVPSSAPSCSSFLFPTSCFIISVLWLFAIEIGVEFWYRSHERRLDSRIKWTARWPESAPAFREIRISEDVKNTLRFDEGREVAWKGLDLATVDAKSPTREQPNCFLFFFRWEPGSSTILRARAHRPDVCLPNVGWRQVADHGTRTYRASQNLALPFRHFSFVRNTMPGQRPVFAHAFFCMREDKLNATADPSRDFDLNEGAPAAWSRSDRWRVVREGLRNSGQQVMEFILMSGQEINGAEAEAKFATLVPEIVEESKK